jgi:hypothetical protein
MDKFSEALMKFSGSLVAQYETVFEHHGNAGDSRESAVNEYLLKVMPSHFGFSKGEMFDSVGANSGEVDLIIYDSVFSPIFSDGSGKILAPFESCFGAIECKSTLTTAELKDSVQKIEKYRSMKRAVKIANAAQLLPYVRVSAGPYMKIGASYNVPLFGVFAFDNKIALDTLLDLLKLDVAIDYIVVPGKFIYISRTSARPAPIGTNHMILETENAVAVWIMYLQTMLSGIKLIGIDTAGLLQRLTAEMPFRRKVFGPADRNKPTPSEEFDGQ